MNTSRPLSDANSSNLSDWLTDAVALVQRVNARLKSVSAPKPVRRQERTVLTDRRCVELAALVDHGG